MSAGADIAAGARALGPGTRLTPREIGLLSALGVDEVPVAGNRGSGSSRPATSWFAPERRSIPRAARSTT